MSSASISVPTLPRLGERSALLGLLPWLFGLTLFVSATLLFLVQPMFARMVLPLLGGTPAVWNTCVVFFQAALLAGYLYSHLSTSYLSPRAQLVLHVVVLLLPWLVLPVSLAGWGAPPGEDSPFGWLLLLLTATVGLPFFAVSTSAPLLQRWFANTAHPAARDPYFLYAASNVGSMLALLAYPFLIEPNFALARQSFVWEVGYGMLVLLIIGCALLSRFTPGSSQVVQAADTTDTARPTMSLQLRWVALGLVPSSLLLGVTTHLTTDVAAIPLLWVLPLALYLATFIVVFSRLGDRVHPFFVRLTPMVALLVLAKLFTEVGMPTGLDVSVHMAAFFVLSMACHGELARTRPAARYLTRFYLLMSLGGVLGGLFNTLIAPVVFSSSLEYPLALALACTLLPVAAGQSRFVRADVLWALGITVVGAVYCFVARRMDMAEMAARVGDVGALSARLLPALLPLGLCFLTSSRPVRFGLTVAGLLAVSVALEDPAGLILHRSRGFFGQIAVRHDPAQNTNWLVHGTTLHGKQARDPEKRQQPLTYYHFTGPMEQVFALPAAKRKNIGVTGLGMGSLSCRARSGQAWTFYEIDPVVARVAEDERYFSCLADARRRGVSVEVALGDARLRLVDAPAHRYDVLILDCFSSDAVPMHLISHEAVQLYLAKLADDGVLVFNISNRYLDLEPVLARAAREENLVALTRLDRGRLDEFPDKTASRWLVMARKREALAGLVATGDWSEARERPGVELWRDDFSNLFSVFMWRE
jgi:hypothetical protein